LWRVVRAVEGGGGIAKAGRPEEAGAAEGGRSSGGAAPEPEKAREVGEEHFCDRSRKNHGCDE